MLGWEYVYPKLNTSIKQIFRYIMHYKNIITDLLGIQYPILQGPFGGGLSSAKLAAAVSNAGGLGGYGAYQLQPSQLVELVDEIRKLTSKPFNINLWVNDVDESATNLGNEEFANMAKQFKPYFDELNISLPPQPATGIGKFEKQVEVLLSLKPAVFSFVFGIPSKNILATCKKAGIITIGTATTVEEAIALEEADVDLIVASGFEAGGHRPSFLKPAEDSLHGTFSLLQQLSAKIKKPIIAAGGIMDAKGIKAAFQLGASGVQVGTAFLACEESGAPAIYREVLFSQRAQKTTLTKVFTGRLSRGIAGTISDELKDSTGVLPLPLQAIFLTPLRKAAIEQGKTSMLTFWAGQNASLLKHKKVNTLMQELIQNFTSPE